MNFNAAPSPIDGLEISTISNSEIRVQWNEPVSICEVTEYSYEYRLIQQDQCQDVDGPPSGSETSDTEAKLILLEDYSTYHVSVKPKSRGVAGNATYGTGTTGEGGMTNAVFYSLYTVQRITDIQTSLHMFSNYALSDSKKEYDPRSIKICWSCVHKLFRNQIHSNICLKNIGNFKIYFGTHD